MDIEQYDEKHTRIELYSKLAAGMKDIQEGKVQEFDDAMAEIRKDLDI